MVSYRVSLALACLLVLGVNAPAQTIVVFEDNDPPTPDQPDPPGGGLVGGTLMNIPDPLLDDGEDDTAGLVTTLGAQFNNINTGIITLPPEAAGSRFRLSFDYLVPDQLMLADETVITTDLTDEDVIFAQINLDQGAGIANRGSAGFVGAGGIERNVWITQTVGALTFPADDPTNGVRLPADATAFQGFFQVVDGGFNFEDPVIDFPAEGGIAYLVDNVSFELLTNITDGDFNGDSIVSAADYTAFRDSVGATSDNVINNAGNGFDGVTNADLPFFAANFGTDNSGGTPQVTAVPEPGALALVLGSLVGVAAGRRRR